MLALDYQLEFDPARDAEFFRSLPEHGAVVVVEAWEANAEPYLVRTANLRRRLERLLGPPDPLAKRLNLRQFARRVRYRLTGSRFEQAFAHYQHAKRLFPRRYLALARLRPPALLKVNLSNAYPRCYVTRKMRTADSSGEPLGGIYYGPFPSRHAAQAFAEKFLDLFKIRRCQIKIRRDPAFPGCIYSEMKMCLAPCFAGCTKQEYAGEVTRVVTFLETSGASLTAEIEREREAASEALDFERAAALHKRLDRVNDVLRGLPELPRKVQQLDAVVLQRAAEEHTVAVFAVRAGRIAEPFVVRFAELAGKPRSVEEILRAQLEPYAASGGSSGDSNSDDRSADTWRARVQLQGGKENEIVSAVAAHRHDTLQKEDGSEHLALLSRWYYSKPREGEIFFRQAGWPYRRILRACSRILAPTSSVAAAQPAPPSGTAEPAE